MDDKDGSDGFLELAADRSSSGDGRVLQHWAGRRPGGGRCSVHGLLASEAKSKSYSPVDLIEMGEAQLLIPSSTYIVQLAAALIF